MAALAKTVPIPPKWFRNYRGLKIKPWLKRVPIPPKWFRNNGTVYTGAASQSGPNPPQVV